LGEIRPACSASVLQNTLNLCYHKNYNNHFDASINLPFLKVDVPLRHRILFSAWTVWKCYQEPVCSTFLAKALHISSLSEINHSLKSLEKEHLIEQTNAGNWRPRSNSDRNRRGSSKWYTVTAGGRFQLAFEMMNRGVPHEV